MCLPLCGNISLNVRLDKVSDEHKVSGIGMGKRLLFWDFPRASWQYDIVVALILLFIFAVPREWFRDQPKAASVVLLSSVRGANRVFISTELLANVAEERRAQQATELIRQRTGKPWRVDRVEPIKDEADGDTKGYIAYTTR